jgi:bifunctional DNA primase/polymerase-like protein/primase-like protein
VGIHTGQASGLVVLDVDPRHGGDETLRELEAKYGPLPETPTALSGGGGRHFYFLHPGFYISSRSDALGIGLDIKGDKGSIIAPPSLHARGGQYRWMEGRYPIVPLAPLPEWMGALLQEPRRSGTQGSGRSRGSWSIGEVGFIPKEQRHNYLVSIAGRLRYWEADEGEILETLRRVNSTRFQEAVPDREVQGIARWAARLKPGAGAAPEAYTDQESAQQLDTQHGDNRNEEEESTSTEQVTQRIAARLADMHTLQEELTSSPHSHDELELALAAATSLAVSSQDDSALVWLLIVGVPSSDKTATMLLLKDSPQTYYLDTLTVNSFASGFMDARPGTGKQPDLLPLLNGKCLVIKDLTTLFSLRDDAVKKVLGDLQSIYDGEYAKATGTVGVIRHQSRFALVGCITPHALTKHHNYRLSDKDS